MQFKSSRMLFSCVASALILLQPASAFCWGPVGHEAVGFLAEDMVSPQTQTALSQILGNVTLDQIANCADALRDASTDCAGLFDPPLQQDDLTAPWHFVNIPLSAEVSQTPATAAIDQYKDCDEAATGPTATAMQDSVEDCVRGQVQFAVGVLRAPAPELPAGAAPQQAQAQAASVLRRRRMALMYLVHLEADAHQPLHVTNDNDEGGNKEQVIFQGRRQSLHHLWDGAIGAQNAMNAKALAELLKKDLSRLPQSEIDGWTQGGLDAVINAGIGEGFNIAKNTIYPNYFAAKAASPGARAVPLGDDYQSQMQPIAFKRLQQAAVRLAFLLDQSLGQNPDFAAPQEKTSAMAGAWRKHGRLNLKKPDLSGATWDGRAPILPKN
ncbi:MAG: hypothetical protein KGL04_08325 [Elusimicrobia bacterium]|nr:hypothetical protein [Elusimicrobiota bacterium]